MSKGRLDTLEEIKTPGAKNDAGKLRYDLLDERAEEALAAVMTFGAHKYTPNGWREVEDAHDRYYGALRRHWREFRKFLATGEDKHWLDEETGFPHIAMFYTNAHFITALALDDFAEDFDGKASADEAIRRWEAFKLKVQAAKAKEKKPRQKKSK